MHLYPAIWIVTFVLWIPGFRQSSFEDKNKDIILMETEEAYGVVLNAMLEYVGINMNLTSFYDSNFNQPAHIWYCL